MSMRKLAFLLVLMLTASQSNSSGQSTNSKPVEPEALGVVFLLDSSNQVLKPLADEVWKAHGNMGFTKATGVVEVAGEHSTFRIAANNKFEFVFKVEHPENVKLYRSLQKKNQRQFELVKIANSGRTREPIQGIPVEITKYGESSFKLAPQSPLAPGEYAIIYGEKVLSFGVDGG